MLTTQGFRLECIKHLQSVMTNTCVHKHVCGQHSTVSPPLIPLAPHPRLHTETLAELWRSKTQLPYFLYQKHISTFFLLELHISQQLCHPLLLVPFLGEA